MKSLVPLLLAAVGCGRGEPPAPPMPRAVAAGGPRNVFRVSDQLLGGSSPDGPNGFAFLKALGVKTIISVDGATPDVAEAETHGLRYVHLPVGYDGIPREQALRLAKAVRDLPGPVYVHCHHGKHRGPAACAAIQLVLDPNFTPEDAGKLMADAGTDPKYVGLVGLPNTLTRPTAGELDRVPSDFPKTAVVPDLVKRMVVIDERWDHLKLAKAAGRATPTDHPDIDPPHEALQLVEHYREVARLPSAKGMPFAEAEAAATALETALRAKDGTAAEVAFSRSAKACANCHAAHRDAPRR